MTHLSVCRESEADWHMDGASYASGGAELCMSIGPRHASWEGLISSALCTEDTEHSLWIDTKQSMIVASIIFFVLFRY